jgi:hypothetical protein
VSVYRENALAPPEPPKPRTFLGRIRRLNQRVLLWWRGPFLKRYPWPCSQCGNRRTAEERYHERGNPHFPTKQIVIHHTCCNETYHSDKKVGTYYRPYPRPARELPQKRMRAYRVLKEFEVKREFVLPSHNVNILVPAGAELRFDGVTVDFAGTTFTYPQLKSGIESGWLVEKRPIPGPGKGRIG